MKLVANHFKNDSFRKKFDRICETIDKTIKFICCVTVYKILLICWLIYPTECDILIFVTKKEVLLHLHNRNRKLETLEKQLDGLQNKKARKKAKKKL